jgi:hypothetical protein
MMRSKLNPLQQELANLPGTGPHPDFDILTAFAEGKLLARERDEVLAHLSACAACRELLSTAAAAQQQPVTELKPYLVARPTPPPLKTWLPWVSIAATILVACATVLFYKYKVDFSGHTTVAEKNSASGSSSIPPTPAPDHHAATPAQPTALSAAGSGSQASQVSDIPATRPHWRINNAGQPERSYDGGSWQAVLPDEKSKMRVISVFDADVWIGGENTTLYHSPDNGLTWKQVNLPQKNGREHAITHIHFQSAQAGKVEAADGTSWSTVNAGVTWE